MAVPDISVCMIVKNEEEHLPALLASIRELPCELVVVDTGSTDRTVEICREAGAKVVEWAWRNDFAAARNVSLDHATGRWIVWFDADDKVPPESIPRIVELASGRPVKAYGFLVKNSLEVNHAGSFFSQLRMFPNHPRLRFVSPVHEQIYPALTQVGIPIEYTDLLVLHTGYTTPEVMRAKQIRNRGILRTALENEATDAIKWYQLGAAENTQGDHAKAEEAFLKCLDLLSKGDPNQHLRTIAPAFLALAVEPQRGPEEALAALLKHASENLSEWHPSQLVLASKYTARTAGDEKALELWEKSFDPVMRPTLLPIDATEACMESLRWLGDYWKARHERLAVAILRLLKGILEGRKEPRRALPDLYMAHGLPERASELYAWCIEMDQADPANWAGLVQSLRAMRDPTADQYLAAARERYPGDPVLARL
jgi:tetratricopeptide (TPR) repeat protein